MNRKLSPLRYRNGSVAHALADHRVVARCRCTIVHGTTRTVTLPNRGFQVSSYTFRGRSRRGVWDVWWTSPPSVIVNGVDINDTVWARVRITALYLAGGGRVCLVASTLSFSCRLFAARRLHIRGDLGRLRSRAQRKLEDIANTDATGSC